MTRPQVSSMADTALTIIVAEELVRDRRGFSNAPLAVVQPEQRASLLQLEPWSI
jgi:hypothetical protein